MYRLRPIVGRLLNGYSRSSHTVDSSQHFPEVGWRLSLQTSKDSQIVLDVSIVCIVGEILCCRLSNRCELCTRGYPSSISSSRSKSSIDAYSMTILPFPLLSSIVTFMPRLSRSLRSAS